MADFRWKTLAFSVALAAAGAGACGTEPAAPKVGSPITGTGTTDGGTSTSAQTVTVATAAQLAKGEALAGSYLVAFKVPSGGPGLHFASFKEEYRAHFQFLSEGYLDDPRVKDVRVLSAVNLRSSPAKAALGDLPPYVAALAGDGGNDLPGSLAQVDFTSADNAAQALKDWDSRGALWYAEPNYVSHTSAADTTNLFTNYATSYVTKLSADWWLTSIHLTDAFTAIANRDQTAAGVPTDQQLGPGQGPIVAVLDSGIDYGHPALTKNIWTNSDTNAANCDNDVHGCNTTVARRGSLGNGDVWPYAADGPNQSCEGKDENCSHGTHVAGLIAADASWQDPGSGSYVGGVCPVCQIMILKIVGKVGSDSGILDSSIIAAFKYVTLFRRQGSPAVRVMNASFGKFVRTRSVGLLIRLMKEDTGTLLVAAAGNEDTLTQEYPAAFSDAVAVAAVDQQLNKVSFSNFGRWVSISAPGNDMSSTVPGAGIEPKSGTSMATPMVAGVVGLLLARYPGIGFDDLRNAVLSSADPTLYDPGRGGGFNYNYYYPKIAQDSVRQPLLGYGMLNAAAAVNRTTSQELPLFSPLDRVRPGCSVVGGAAEGGGHATRMVALLTVLLAPLLSLVLPFRSSVPPLLRGLPGRPALCRPRRSGGTEKQRDYILQVKRAMLR